MLRRVSLLVSLVCAVCGVRSSQPHDSSRRLPDGRRTTHDYTKMSLGFMSSILPKRSKPIENVGDGTISRLKRLIAEKKRNAGGEDCRRKERRRRKREDAVGDEEGRTWRGARSRKRKNRGVDDRDQKDRDARIHEERRLARSAAKLAEKTRLYEARARKADLEPSSVTPGDDGDPLVDFDRKRRQGGLATVVARDERGPPPSPPPIEPSVLVVQDEFGRERRWVRGSKEYARHFRERRRRLERGDDGARAPWERATLGPREKAALEDIRVETRRKRIECRVDSLLSSVLRSPSSRGGRGAG